MDYIVRNAQGQPGFKKSIQKRRSITSTLVQNDAENLLLLHPPRQGLQFLWKNNPDPNFEGGGAFYIVGLVLNGGEWMRQRMSLTLSVIITVATLSLGISMPLLANPEFALLERSKSSVNGTLTFEDAATADDTFVKVYHILIALSVAFELWSLITCFGVAFLLNQSLRDIDLVNTLHYVAFTEFFFCYVTLMIGIMCQILALGIKGLTHYTLSTAVPVSVILFLGYFGVFGITVKLGYVSWQGLLGKKLNDPYHGWNQNIAICNKILKSLSDLSPEYEANRNNSTIPDIINKMDLEIVTSNPIADDSNNDEWSEE